MIKNTITLIGMPGAGKSTLGVQLAKVRAMKFVDTDLLIQQHVKMSLQNYLEKNGYKALRHEEQTQLLRHDFSGTVVATGGSAVYSEEAMLRLQKLGPRIYLSIDYPTLCERVTNESSRGLAVSKGTSLKELFEQRLPLYEKWASHTISCSGKSPHQVLQELETLTLSLC